MSSWARVEDPRARRARSWVFNVVVLLVATLPSVAAVATGTTNELLGALVLAGLTLPLLVRRVWPVGAFAVQMVVAAAFGWWAQEAVWSAGLLVGLYTVAALRPRRDALWAAAALEAGIVAAAIRIEDGSGHWWATAIALTAVMVAALALGLYVGTRRTLLASLRARAEQLERDRDQQVALAAAAERARIAREMHDIVAHHLTVMVALSEGAVAASGRSPERAAEVMRTVSATGRQALSDTRRLLGVLREDDGADADRNPLPDLSDLDALLTRVRGAGLPVRLTVQGGGAEVPPAVQLTLYRLVQEALTNTMKHAGGGASATVALRYATDVVVVDVTDDGGTRPHPPSAHGSGRGLAGMRERVAAFGGEVRTGPDGHGWRVRATVRLDEEVSA